MLLSCTPRTTTRHPATVLKKESSTPSIPFSSHTHGQNTSLHNAYFFLLVDIFFFKRTYRRWSYDHSRLLPSSLSIDTLSHACL